MTKMTSGVEWPTLGMLAACYAAWAAAVFWLPGVSLWLAVPVAAWAIAQHSSLQHEMIHGHPFRDPRLNAALVFPALTLVVPYLRFRDTHLAHHHDANLTDPYDDPESNYLAERDWNRLPAWLRLVLRVNNTLAGRLLIGPVVGQVFWMTSDWRAARGGDRRVIAGWLWHLPAMAAALALVLASDMPLWAYGIAAYGGLSLLKIRTFLEHQAHGHHRGPGALRAPVPQQQPARGAPHAPARAVVPAAAALPGQSAALPGGQRRLQLPFLCRDLRALPVAREGPGAASPPAARALSRARRSRASGAPTGSPRSHP